VSITEEILICAKCGTEHDSLPPVRTDMWNGVEQTGVWAKDFTYYRDFYLSRGYVVLCKSHKIEDITQNAEGSNFAGI
jgi:hypothetical protein